jgi:DNA-binding LytR/AlgR family response regulator
VFVTAYDEYATKAFEVAAIDYVLKPVSPERLASTVARLKARQRGLAELARQLRALGPLVPKGEILRQVRAGAGNAVKLIPLDEVCYFQAADKYTTVVTAAGEDLIRTPLKELAAQLPGRSRCRCPSAATINWPSGSTASASSATTPCAPRRRIRTRPSSI